MAVSLGQALSEKPALKPYWGKPAVRNFREGNGNVGIIRSPLRAFALPDQSSENPQVKTHMRMCPPLSVTRASAKKTQVFCNFRETFP